MNSALEYIMTGAAVLILLSIVTSKASSRFGIPALLLFLGIGMLAGSDGPGGIHFDNPWLAQSVGVVALAYILFAGGLDTNWQAIRPVLWQGMSLSTIGVLVTAVVVAWFIHAALDFSWLEALLLGAIVSSTDAAAVFAVLRSRNVSLKGTLRPLLEFESGSNDPMAVFLTTGFIMLVLDRNAGISNFFLMLIWQMSVGAVAGYAIGKGSVVLINRLKLEYDGLYSVLTLALVLLTYGATTIVKGNGFLAVYIAGLVIGNSTFIHKKALVRFHDGLAWLMQITMFLILGLQVYPSQLVPIIPIGLLTAVVLMLVARPIGVFISLLFARQSLRRKILISWVGLRGAVPIVLATFPLLAGVSKAQTIFNIVFFIVLTSALIQGSSIPFVASRLRLDAPLPSRMRFPLEFYEEEISNGRMLGTEIPAGSNAINKRIMDLGFPHGSRIVLVERDDDYIVPEGATILKAGDRLHLIAQTDTLEKVLAILDRKETGS